MALASLSLISTLYPSSPSEACWHCRQGAPDRPGLCSTKVPGAGHLAPGPPTDARTEKTGHSEQSADTRNGIPDTGRWIFSFWISLKSLSRENTIFEGLAAPVRDCQIVKRESMGAWERGRGGSYGRDQNAGDTCETQGSQHHLLEKNTNTQ